MSEGIGDAADAADDDQDFERFADSPEHSWWAAPSTDPTAGADQPGLAPPEHAGPDPYAVLRVARDAPWEQITAVYRRQVRWWHPDGLGEAAPEDRATCEQRIRDLNEAYQELRVRRDRP